MGSFRTDDRPECMDNRTLGVGTETDFAHADIFYPSSFTANMLFVELPGHLRLPQPGPHIAPQTACAR